MPDAEHCPQKQERCAHSLARSPACSHAACKARSHLEQLGITALQVTPNPVRVATEAALWGAVAEHGFLRDAVIVSDDAGQFNVGTHGLCWIHAERLVHKLETFTDQQRAQLLAEGMRSTAAWDAAHPRATSLARKAAISGVPLAQLRDAYRRGWSAWYTAGKPGGLTKQQAAMNRAAQLALGRA